MSRLPILLPVGVLLLLLGQLLLPNAVAEPVAAQGAGNLYVYNQITNFPEGTGTVGYPVLSGDGATAVFSEPFKADDPTSPNRIFTIGSDGSAMTEVDAYTPLCNCGSQVDISNDGATVVSTDSVQVRIADAGGARELIRLAGNEVSSLVITGDAQTVFFIVRRDSATADNATLLPRGVWAIDASGANLRQVVGADDVAALFGVTIDQTGCCFHSDGHPLDASDDGGRIVFISYGGDGEHVLSAKGDGSDLVDLRGDLAYAMRVAISGDGSLAAYDVTPTGTDLNEIAVTPPGAPSPTVLIPAMSYSGYIEPFQLTETGSQLLISSNGLLVDTSTAESVLLGTSITGLGSNQVAVVTDGLPRGTMDATGENFLYVMRSIRCADCPNQQEQLATLTIDPIDLGAAPFISDASIDPPTIGLAGSSDATVTVSVTTDETVLGVGLEALLGGEVDPNIQSTGLLLDDGQNGDVAAGDGSYTTSGITHAPVVARDDDTGPRTIRIAVEVEGADGMRHATAQDIGTLEVDGTAAKS